MKHFHWIIYAFSIVISSYSSEAISEIYTYYRLPLSIRPEHYLLKIITHLETPENFTFNGEVSISFEALEDTTNITLHAQNLTIDSKRIQFFPNDDEEVVSQGIEKVDTIPDHNYYIIYFKQKLFRGHKYKVRLYYSGILKENFYGYYRSSYRDNNTNETRWLSITKFQPTYARMAFPCLDEPNYKARFTIRLDLLYGCLEYI